MKLVVNVGLSLIMLALCVWLVWPDAGQRQNIGDAIERLDLAAFAPYFVAHLLLLSLTHFSRAWRWNNLLRPIGVSLGPARLLAVSSVGFMAILALPARLGEFVRPALIRQKGKISAASALGTIAVERIIDGLLVSLFVFGALFAKRGPDAPSWMMPTAYAALGIFSAATIFLLFALRWPKGTVDLCLRLSLLPKVSPLLAHKIDRALHKIITGFRVLGDRQNLVIFVLWSLLYWSANSMSLWVLARGIGLDLSILGAFATTGLVAVGITLPNSPGLVGQFQYFTLLALGLYLPMDSEGVEAQAFVFAVALHLIQVVWYLGMGALALATPYVSLSEVAAARELPDDEDDG